MYINKKIEEYKMDEYSIADVGIIKKTNDIDTKHNNDEAAENDIKEMVDKMLLGKKKKKKRDELEILTGFTYDDLLARCLILTKESRECKRKVVKLPEINAKYIDRRTVIENFDTICKALDRTQEHVINFITSELCTDGSVKQNNNLVLKGNFKQHAITNIINKYINKYNVCQSCKNQATKLEKDYINRINYIKCPYCKTQTNMK